MKYVTLTICLLMAMVGLQSHEFWLEPIKFKIQPGEAINIKFAVGEDFTGADWDLGKLLTQKMQLFEKQGTQDLLKMVPATKGSKMKVTIANPGTKLIAMNSKPSFIALNGTKFNAYLEEDGLENIIDWRRQNGQDTVGAKEFYSRYAKLMVQSGNVLDDTWKKVVGQRLEIIPQQNPYTLKSGDYLSCKVLYEGKPSPHTMVKVWGHVGNKIFLQNAYTEDDGTVKFPISANGPWMISSVRMEKSKDPKADWESSWASLVFSVE
jgi:uncharacterized GH25 family protein